MPIPFSCPSCGKGLHAPDDKAGRKTKCPKCGTPVVVPTPLRESPERTSVEVPPEPVKQLTPPPVICRSCGGAILSDPLFAGLFGMCPHCQAAVLMPGTPAAPLPQQAPSPLQVTCGSCGRKILADISFAGQTFMCPHCRWPILLPGTPVPAPQPKSLPAPTPVQPAAPIQPTWVAVEEPTKRHKEDEDHRTLVPSIKRTSVLSSNAGREFEEDQRTLLPCPDCGHSISRKALSCPKCGSPIRGTVTIELTGKRWKALQLIGGSGFVAGLFFWAAVAGGNYSPEFNSVGRIATPLLIFGGLLLYSIGRIGGWWYHG